MEYKVIQDFTYYKDGQIYRVGDTVEIDAAELARFKEYVAEIEPEAEAEPEQPKRAKVKA